MQRRLSFLPGPVAASLASAILTILFAMYIAPYGTIYCGPPALRSPDVHTGQAFFDKPDTTVLSIRKDGTCYLRRNAVANRDLVARLRDARAKAPDLPLELQADGRLDTHVVLRVLAAAREAGYVEAYVFGQEHSLLAVTASSDPAS